MPSRSRRAPMKPGQIRDRRGIIKRTRQPVWTPERVRIREILLEHLRHHDLAIGDITKLAQQHGIERWRIVKVKELLAIEGLLRRQRE